MGFSYDYYYELLKLLFENDYKATSYDEPYIFDRSFILRHDVDYSLDKTVRIAEIDHDLGIKSTFFVLLSSDFYNVYSLRGKRVIDDLHSLGHEIGLHFDEQRYPEYIGKPDAIRSCITHEADILSKEIGLPVSKVSMHRPSREIIDCDLKIRGMVNTYGKEYILNYKYVSDSRRRWREPFEDYVRERQYDRFQILVHPFWYNEQELSIKESLGRYIRSASSERYDQLDENITDLGEIIGKEELWD